MSYMNSLQPEAWSEGGVSIACGVRLDGPLQNVTGSRIVPLINQGRRFLFLIF